MPGTDALARMLIGLGVLLIVVGGLLLLLGRVPGMGRLPGDIIIQRDGFSLYVPLVTMLIVSIVLTVLLNLLFLLLRR
jgi:hypothetical protein